MIYHELDEEAKSSLSAEDLLLSRLVKTEHMQFLLEQLYQNAMENRAFEKLNFSRTEDAIADHAASWAHLLLLRKLTTFGIVAK
jgi:hypothetical protein